MDDPMWLATGLLLCGIGVFDLFTKHGKPQKALAYFWIVFGLYWIFFVEAP